MWGGGRLHSLKHDGLSEQSAWVEPPGAQAQCWPAKVGLTSSTELCLRCVCLLSDPKPDRKQTLRAATPTLQGSATLSMAYAGALFADACLRGLNGESNIFDYTYVESEVTEVPYFASKVELGPDGEHCSCSSCKSCFSKASSGGEQRCYGCLWAHLH